LDPQLILKTSCGQKLRVGKLRVCNSCVRNCACARCTCPWWFSRRNPNKY